MGVVVKPKVSVIIPVYNVQSFLADCLNSALQQTLSNIEIICVNDGSTDSSPEILKEFEQKDSRIKVINKENAGYGAAMNDGIKAASGEYLAFLESDDQIDNNAYKRLSELADSYDVDIIKGNYYTLFGSGKTKELKEIKLTKVSERYGTVFNPLSEPWSFYIPMMNCLGLFRTSLITENNILHNETPGAAHQDMGFWFQTLCCANKMVLVDEPFYMYRQDNANSSMKDDKTAFLTLKEYDFMKEFLDKRGDLKELALPIYSHRKYGSCMFAYSNAELSLKLPFARELSKSFNAELVKSEFPLERFTKNEHKKFNTLIEDPDAFYLQSLGYEIDASQSALKEMKEEISRLNKRIENIQIVSEANSLSGEEISTNSKEIKPEVEFSVIIPVFNSEDFLRECLDSVLNQTFTDFEVICINDGSTDGSVEILKEYSEKDQRFTYVSQENRGQGAARNHGLSLARGRYIQFLDSDDMFLPHAFEQIHKVLEENNLDLLFFDGDVFYDGENENNPKDFRPDLYRRNKNYGIGLPGQRMLVEMSKNDEYRVSPCMATFRRSFLFENKISFPEYIIYEDNVFTAEAISLSKNCGHLPLSLYSRRVRTNSTMTSKKTAFNVISYFKVFVEMYKFSKECELTLDAAEALEKEMGKVLYSTRNYFKKLSLVQQEITLSTTPTDRSLLVTIVGEWNIKALQNKNRSGLSEIGKLKRSNSWKIGRAVTYLPRKIKRTAKKLGK